mgnify:CR=1 FL=1
MNKILKLTAIIFSIVLVLCSAEIIRSCKKQDEKVTTKKDYLEIYTNNNIYYVDLKKLEVSNEKTQKVKRFENLYKLSDYLSTATANDANLANVDLPEDYQKITPETPITGEYDSKSNTFYIQFKN